MRFLATILPTIILAVFVQLFLPLCFAKPLIAELPEICSHISYSAEPTKSCQVAPAKFTSKQKTVSVLYDPSSEDHETQLLDLSKIGVDFLIVEKEMEGSESDPHKLLLAYQYLTCVKEEDHLPTMGLYLEFDKAKNLNWATEQGKTDVYQSIVEHFCKVPQVLWATIDDKPLVFLGSTKELLGVDYLMIDYLKARFQSDFDKELFVVRDRRRGSFKLGKAKLNGRTITDDRPESYNDPAGLDAIVSIDAEVLDTAGELFRERLSLEQAIIKIVSSKEFYKNSGSTSEGFFSELSKRLLFRSGDSSISISGNGTSTQSKRAEIVKSLFEQKYRREIYAGLVAYWYRQYLHSTESFQDLKKAALSKRRGNTDLSTWVGMLERGVHYDAVRLNIFASQDFYNAAGRTVEGFIRRIYETLYFRCTSPQLLQVWNEFLRYHSRSLNGSRNLPPSLRKEIVSRILAKAVTKSQDVNWMHDHFYGIEHNWPGPGDSVFDSDSGTCPSYAGVASIGAERGLGLPNASFLGQPSKGELYQDAWNLIHKMSPKPSMVILLSWNTQGSTDEDSREDVYGDDFDFITKMNIDRYKG